MNLQTKKGAICYGICNLPFHWCFCLQASLITNGILRDKSWQVTSISIMSLIWPVIQQAAGSLQWTRKCLQVLFFEIEDKGGTTFKISYGFILMLGEPWCPSLFMRIVIINKTLVSWHLKTSEVLLGAELIENASLNLTSFWWGYLTSLVMMLPRLTRQYMIYYMFFSTQKSRIFLCWRQFTCPNTSFVILGLPPRQRVWVTPLDSPKTLQYGFTKTRKSAAFI